MVLRWTNWIWVIIWNNWSSYCLHTLFSQLWFYRFSQKRTRALLTPPEVSMSPISLFWATPETFSFILRFISKSKPCEKWSVPPLSCFVNTARERKTLLSHISPVLYGLLYTATCTLTHAFSPYDTSQYPPPTQRQRIQLLSEDKASRAWLKPSIHVG